MSRRRAFWSGPEASASETPPANAARRENQAAAARAGEVVVAAWPRIVARAATAEKGVARLGGGAIDAVGETIVADCEVGAASAACAGGLAKRLALPTVKLPPSGKADALLT